MGPVRNGRRDGALALAHASHAAQVTFEVSGTVRAIYVPSGGPVWSDLEADLTSLGVVVGAPLSATVTYDDSAPVLLSNPLYTLYYGPSIVGVAFEVGAVHGSSGGDALGQIYALQNSPISIGGEDITALGNPDLLAIGAPADLGPSLGTSPNAGVTFMGDSLEDWADGTLPSFPPDLVDVFPFDLATLLAYDQTTAIGFGVERCRETPFGDECQSVSVVADLASLVMVPEPGSGVLVILALAALAVRRR